MGDLIKSATLVEQLGIIGVLALMMFIFGGAYWRSTLAHTKTLVGWAAKETASADEARARTAAAVKSLDEVRDVGNANSAKLDAIYAILVNRGRRE